MYGGGNGESTVDRPYVDVHTDHPKDYGSMEAIPTEKVVGGHITDKGMRLVDLKKKEKTTSNNFNFIASSQQPELHVCIVYVIFENCTNNLIPCQHLHKLSDCIQGKDQQCFLKFCRLQPAKAKVIL